MWQEPLSFQAKIYFPLLATKNHKSIREVLLARVALTIPQKTLKPHQQGFPLPRTRLWNAAMAEYPKQPEFPFWRQHIEQWPQVLRAGWIFKQSLFTSKT